MPLPFCNCPHHQNPPNPYDNYDIPKILPTPQTKRVSDSMSVNYLMQNLNKIQTLVF